MSSPKPSNRSQSLPGEACHHAPSLKELVSMTLAEDIGSGDVTAALIPAKTMGEGIFVAKSEGRLSGLKTAREVFRQLAPRATFTAMMRDGDPFSPGDQLASVRASVRVLLTGERTALNFLQQLSGVATMTSRFIEALGSDSPIHVFDTRKTVPLLRALQKEAVLHGGGRNHRMGLFDMALIKNNHVDACGSVTAAVARLAEDGFFKRKPRLKLCVEARDNNEAREAAACGADIIMLDNMSASEIRRAVEVIENETRSSGNPPPEIEISGGITPTALRRMRNLPIQRVSAGALTHSAPAADISFRIRPL